MHSAPHLSRSGQTVPAPQHTLPSCLDARHCSAFNSGKQRVAAITALEQPTRSHGRDRLDHAQFSARPLRPAAPRQRQPLCRHRKAVAMAMLYDSYGGITASTQDQAAAPSKARSWRDAALHAMRSALWSVLSNRRHIWLSTSARSAQDGPEIRTDKAAPRHTMRATRRPARPRPCTLPPPHRPAARARSSHCAR